MKVLIVGAGGIGSWLVPELCSGAMKRGQFKDCHFTLADPDRVDADNLLHQNFDIDDAKLNYLKVQSLQERYEGVDEVIAEKIVSPEQLEGYDVVIGCVDNNDFRRMMFEHGDEIPFWIDLRAHDRYHQEINKDARLPINVLRVLSEPNKDPNAAQSQSCLSPESKESSMMQWGHKAAAMHGAQLFANHYRGISKGWKDGFYV